MYWLELKKFFEAIDVEFPILVPRNSLAFITEKHFVRSKTGLMCRKFLWKLSGSCSQ